MKIELGGGTHPKGDGYLNVDQLDVADIKHDLSLFPWPFDDESVDAVYSSHCIEHLTSGPQPFVREIARICKVGARVEIRAPDPQSDMAMCAGHVHVFSMTQVRHFDIFPHMWWSGCDRRLVFKRVEFGADSHYFEAARKSKLFHGWTDNEIMTWIPRTKHENRFHFVVGKVSNDKTKEDTAATGMKIGLDLDGTVYAYPEFFRELVAAMSERGHKFFCTSSHGINEWPGDCERLRKLGFNPDLISPELMYHKRHDDVRVKAKRADQLDLVFDDDGRIQQYTRTPIFAPPNGSKNGYSFQRFS